MPVPTSSPAIASTVIIAAFSRVTAPDHPVGRTLLWARMWWQLLPGLLSDRYDADFIRLCRQLVPRYTMLAVPRLKSLYDRIADLAVRQIEGAVVECGVWNGGASAMMAASMACSGHWRDIWLFDSFEGLPQPTAGDPPEVHAAYHAGWCKGHADLASEVVVAQGLPEERLHVIPGWFHESFPHHDPGRIALLHVDADWYEPVKLCLERYYDQVSPGGIVVLDDYGRWAGCRLATTEFLAERHIQAELHHVDESCVYFVKPLSLCA